ncbi:T9SS type B sorting domain-containing protein [Ferruginibacter yonginensis]|uniref:T9SS type B sorting domain-containing protein n=1 Tax=Ferruginibacter yonginensis TaxID=1310416 RepID=A0ABV8QQI5_9BACT
MKLFKRFSGFLIVMLLFSEFVQAQLCQGSLGDPIINITFGSGTNPGPALSAATTAYQFVGNDCPNDGFYTVRNNTNNCFGNTWHSLNTDHTNNGNGYFMLVNASVQPNPFYIDTVRGLCSNTTYEFAAWIMNVILPTSCNNNTIQPNITFRIEQVDGTVLQTYNTNNIPPTNAPIWKQYGFFFTTPPNVGNLVLRMINNAGGGCGNDLALDDITFRPCGPLLSPSINGNTSDTSNICKGTSQNFVFNCNVSSGFNNPVYQWQQSTNNITYTDILNENTTTLNVAFANNAAVGNYYYRLSVAEAGNIGSPSCRVSSSPILVKVNPLPVTTAINSGPVCEATVLNFSATGGNNYNWVGPNGFTATIANPSIINTTLNSSGKYYVTVTDNVTGCQNIDSTTVVVNPSPIVSVTPTTTTLCESVSQLLNATGANNYEWSPPNGLSNSNINNPTASPTATTNYQVIGKNSFGCADTAFATINVIKLPLVNAGADRFIVANNPIQLDANINGTYNSFQWSPPTFISDVLVLNPIVNPPADDRYILSVTSLNNCGVVNDTVYVKIYQGIFIPNSFTPNADGKNDVWNIPALAAYPDHTLMVYNRYGQTVFQRSKSLIGWNGLFKGEPLPTGAYTYIIDLKNGTPVLKGTVLLLR